MTRGCSTNKAFPNLIAVDPIGDAFSLAGRLARVCNLFPSGRSITANGSGSVQVGLGALLFMHGRGLEVHFSFFCRFEHFFQNVHSLPVTVNGV